MNKHSAKRWEDPKWVRRYQKSVKATPNKTESKLAALMPPNVRFVGDGTFYLRFKNGRFKNPDFKVTGKKVVIELFGGMGWFHSEEEAHELVRLYEEIGYRCLIITGNEARRKDVGAKIAAFLNP